MLAVHKETPESDIVSNAVAERKESARLHLPTMVREKIYLAVHRFDNSIYYRRVEREAFLILSGLQAQKTLGEAIESAFARSRLSPEEQAAIIQGCFAHAAELGWFCREQFDASSIQ